MRLSGIAALFLGTVAAAIESHQLRLPYLPHSSSSYSQSQADGASYLLIDWSIRNGTVYANDDQMFPPSILTHLRAPLYKSTDMVYIDKNDLPQLQLSYALHIRPLATKDTTTGAQMVRVRFELLGPEGEPVTSYVAVLDLCRSRFGDHSITNVGLEPNSQHHQPRPLRPWQMKYWQTRLGSFFKDARRETTELSAQSHILRSRATPNDDAASKINKGASEISPFWAPSSSNHPTNRPDWQSDSEPNQGFLKGMRPFILPACVGVVVGFMVCLIGFVIGYFTVYLLSRYGPWKRPLGRSRMSPTMSVTENSRHAQRERLTVPGTYVDAEEV